MDLDADGRLDLVTATYDGSPHVAYGVEGGFGEPTHLLDAAGERIRLKMFWDHGVKRWTDVRQAHCTSAVLFDWDGDGDLDLLLGDKSEGGLWLMLNDGKPGEQRFAGTSVEVLAGGAPFGLHGGMTAPRLVDWDGDGLVDVVAGSYGQIASGVGKGEAPTLGGVWWFRNVGEVGAPRFAPKVALIPPSAAPTTDAPWKGLFADPVDVDGDGDLDLLVGGYASVPGDETGKRTKAGVWLYRREG